MFAGAEHRLGAPVEVGCVEAALNPALALVHLSAYLGIHSKFLVRYGC
jgi:hypothetical protein